MGTLLENRVGEEEVQKKETGKAKRGDSVKAVLPLKPLLITAVPLGLLVLYLTVIGPGLLPLPAKLEPSFPAATRLLSEVCLWCAANWHWTLLIAAGLLFGNVVVRMQPSRYFGWVAVVSTLALGFSYYSISCPIERLFKAVKEGLPEDRRSELGR